MKFASGHNPIRLIIRSILSEGGAGDFGGPRTPRSPGQRDVWDRFTTNDKINFGSWEGVKSYKGKDDSVLVLKLSLDAGDSTKSWDSAAALGGRPVPDEYLKKGSNFELDLRKDVNSDEAIARNFQIARAKSNSDIKKTAPFNGSNSFYVVVDSNNINLRDSKVIESQRQFAENTMLGLMLNDPLRGYGKLVHSLPAQEQKYFIKALSDVSATSSLISGGAGLGGLVFSGAPGLQVAKGAAAAAAIGPFLALSSIALDDGHPWIAAGNLLAAATFGWDALGGLTAAYASAVESAKVAKAASQASRSAATQLFATSELSGLERLAEKLFKIQGRLLGQMDNFIKFIKGTSSLLTGTLWQGAKQGWNLMKGGVPILDNAGNAIIFTSGEKFFLEMVGNAATVAIADNLSKIWESIKSVVRFAFPIALETTGITFDILQLAEKSQDVSTGKLDSKPTKEQEQQMTRTAAANLRTLIRREVGSNDHRDFYRKNIRQGMLAVVNSSDLSKIKYTQKIKIPTLGNMSPDIIFVPESYYDVYDQLARFPGSFFGSRNILFKDGANSVFVFPFSEISIRN